MRYHSKKCKSCGEYRQKGGTFQTQEQIDAANANAKRLVAKHTTDPFFIENAYVARNIGDPIPPIINNYPLQAKQLPMTLPSGVTIDDVQLSSDNQYGYLHPQTGNWTAVDGPAVYSRYGKKPLLPPGQNTLASNFKIKGGRIVAQLGLSVPPPVFTPLSSSETTTTTQDPVQELINKGLYWSPKNDDPQEFINQYNLPQTIQESPFFNPINAYNTLQMAHLPFQYIGNQLENNRQNTYMNNQYSTLGSQNPIPVSNFQPNPYSLYAKYGGSLRKYKKQLVKD